MDKIYKEPGTSIGIINTEFKPYIHTFSSSNIKSYAIVINGVVSITPDGKVEYDEKYTPDEAAKLFWEALRNVFPTVFKSVDNANN